jgi:hypothetical protein
MKKTFDLSQAKRTIAKACCIEKPSIIGKTQIFSGTNFHNRYHHFRANQNAKTNVSSFDKHRCTLSAEEGFSGNNAQAWRHSSGQVMCGIINGVIKKNMKPKFIRIPFAQKEWKEGNLAAEALQ